MNLNDPVATALRVAEALTAARQQYALYGGLLLAAYGEPRETRDVDVAVVELSAEAAREALELAAVPGLVSFVDVRFGGLSISRLALIGGDHDTGLNVLGLVRPRSARYSAGAMARAVTAPLRDRHIRALTPEDFIIFKMLATRDRDLDDATSVFERSGEMLDNGLIDSEVAALAEEITDWDVRGRWAALRSRIGR